MPLTAAQTTAFFEDAGQMGLQECDSYPSNRKDRYTVDDPMDFEDSIEQIANLRRPAGRLIPTCSGGWFGSDTVVFGAKSQQRLISRCKLIRYYDRWPYHRWKSQWTPVMKNFSEQWKALKTRRCR
jgi:hypothetical protein